MAVSAAAGRLTIDRVSHHAHWVLRAALASVFVYHGFDKFMGDGIAGFAQAMDLPWILGLLVALGEIGGGLLILVGAVLGPVLGPWATRLGALAMIGIMLGAIFMVHWGQWHFMATSTHPLGGMQFQVTLLLVAVYLFIKGNDC